MSDLLHSQRLTSAHDLSEFDCGNDSMDDWLRRSALRAQEQGTAAVHVWTEITSPVVLAYHATSATQVVRSDVTGGLAGGNAVVPAYLLARLALDRSLQRQGLGSELLLDALTHICWAARYAAGRLVVVDPIDERARDFYARHDVQAVAGSQRMFAKLASVRRAIGFDETQ
ncbi:GNAT family N-acetyltransferase [Cellulomonas sp. URHB0016]